MGRLLTCGSVPQSRVFTKKEPAVRSTAKSLSHNQGTENDDSAGHLLVAIGCTQCFVECLVPPKQLSHALATTDILVMAVFAASERHNNFSVDSVDGHSIAPAPRSDKQPP